MSRNTRNTKDSVSDNVVPGGVSGDLELKLDALVEKAVAAATKVIHDEFTKLMNELSDRMEVMERRLDDLERRLEHESSTELQRDIQTVRGEARDYARAANDAEQHSRKKNLRIRGLRQKPGENCKDVVLNFCRSVLHVPLTDDDIKVAHPLSAGNRRTRTGLASAAASDVGDGNTGGAQGTDDLVIVRFRNQEVRENIIKRRKILKGTRQTIVEDLTALNVATLNRFRKHPEVDKCWSWKGRLFVSKKDGHTLLVKPFQTLDECSVVS